MKQVLTILCFVVFASVQQAVAERRHWQIPAGVRLSAAQEQLITRHLQACEKALLRGQLPGLNKTSANGQRLVGLADFDYSNPPGSEFVDSLIFKYSGTRSSEFDYFGLYYDVYNSDDLPAEYDYANSYINFDSLWHFDPPGSTNRVLGGARSYTTAGNISRDETIESQLITYQYNLSNQKTRALLSTYDNASMVWENLIRFFFAYDGSGHMTRDSMEIWDGSAWGPYITYTYTYNGNGLPVHTDLFYNAAGPSFLLSTIDMTYPVGISSPNRAFFKQYNQYTMNLENYILDTLGYTNGAISLYDSYDWDSATTAWVPYSKERRHLNANSRPDSAWVRYWSNGNIADSFSLALTYNGQNNPIRAKYYSNGAANLYYESHWYYEAASGTGVGSATIIPLEFYPNPVRDDLKIKNLNSGNYSIYNALGQIVQSGQYHSGISIPMKNLSPGQYVIQVVSNNGEIFAGQLMKE